MLGNYSQMEVHAASQRHGITRIAQEMALTSLGPSRWPAPRHCTASRSAGTAPPQSRVAPATATPSPRRATSCAAVEATSSESQLAAGTTAAASPMTAVATWADGDVLRLQLQDGGVLYAEVLLPQRRPASTKAQQQQPPKSRIASKPRTTAAGTATAAGSAPQPAGPQLLCQGARYTVRQMLSAPSVEGEPGTSEDAGGAPGLGPLEGGPFELVAVGGALSAPDALLSLLAAPPKQHTQALRAWAPLAPRLLRPTPPVPSAPQQPAAAQCRQQGELRQQQQQHVQEQLQALQAQSQQQQEQQQEQRQLVMTQGCDAASPSAAATFAPIVVVGAQRLASLEELRGRAAREPGVWCDGTGPADPPLSPDDLATYTAAELLCLLEGRRGVVLLQLHVGWDEHVNVPPYGPYKPLVLRLLREALARPDIMSYASGAPTSASTPGAGGGSGNASYGMTMVLCADKEPYRSWGGHLASFGCQAALEAQSPYYKVLIGRTLGYRPDNIAHHVKTKHGQEPSLEVLAAVEQQLLKLSGKQPSLPWNASSRGAAGGGGARKKTK